ncbi:hypothetical protein KJ866_02885 [Patescibacteria group bacterium]|nr:hypothetical protein [Patescibacteria group bacterium]
MEKKMPEEDRWAEGKKDKAVNILDIGPNSSPAEIELNERWSSLPNEELIKIVCDGFLSFLMKQPIMGYEDLQEKQGYWWLSVMRNVFAARPNELGFDNYRDFKLCLRCVYLCSLFGKTSSALSFPKVTKKIWEEIMEDWQLKHYNYEWDKKVFSFFFDRFALASEEENKIMLSVLRERLKETDLFCVDGLIDWLWRSKEGERMDRCHGLIRLLAMARASSWRWESVAQDSIGRHLVGSLILEPIKIGGKFLTIKESLLFLDELTSVFVGEMKKAICYYNAVIGLFSQLKRIVGEKAVIAEYQIVSGEHVKIDFSVSREEMNRVAEAIAQYITRCCDLAEEIREETQEHYRGVRLYSGKIISLEIHVIDSRAGDDAAELIKLVWD